MAAWYDTADGDKEDTRGAQFRQAGIALKWPPLTDPVAAVLCRHWEQLGRAGNGYAGPVPLTWSELLAWLQLTGNNLEAWEAEALIYASAHYVDRTYSLGGKPLPPPWDFTQALTPEDRERQQRWAKIRLSGRGPRRTKR